MGKLWSIFSWARSNNREYEIHRPWGAVYSYQSEPIIRNNSLYGNGYGILCYYKSPVIENNTIKSNTHGIYFHTNSPIVSNNTIDANNRPLYLAWKCYPTLINTTFNKDNFYFNDAPSKLTVNWHLDIKVANETGIPIEAANVTIKDKNKDLIYNNFTDKNGTLPTVICKQFEQTQTSKTYFTPHLIRAKKGSGNQTLIEMSESRNITLILRDLPEFFVSEIKFSNNNPNQGETIKINAAIKNIGQKNATNVKVSFFDEQYLIKQNIISIDGKNETNTSVDWLARGGKHEIKLVIDPEDEIFEYNETNNTLKKVIFGKDWIVTETEYYEDETIRLYGNLTIESTGNLTLKDVSLIFECREDGDYHIEVKRGGELNILGSGKKVFDYWIEEYTASSNATVWVKLPLIPTGNETFFMYYGNPSADSNSDFANTFTKGF